MRITIDPDYHLLRLEEINLVADYLELVSLYDETEPAGMEADEIRDETSTADEQAETVAN